MSEKPMRKPSAFTRKEKNWILYDVANSAYVLLASALLSLYFKYLAPSADLLNQWSNAVIIVTLISIILCPILGTFADFSQKKTFFIIFAAIGICGCGILSIFSFLTKWAIASILFFIIYIITEVGHSSALVFYDSMLSDVTTDEKMHEVSAHGYAWGYIASCIPFILCLVCYVLGSMVFKELLGIAFSVCCIITAVWWLIFTLPLCKSYEQLHFLPKPDKPVRSTFKRLGAIFKALTKNKKALLFLFAFFFYIDGVHTIIKMAITIGTVLGFNDVKLVLALLTTQFVAFPCAIIFGKLARKFSCEKMLITAVFSYILIGILAVFLQFEWQFWLLAIGVGMFQGGIQAMSRSYFTKIIPSNESGEFFGLYDIFGKSAAILGISLIKGINKFFPLSGATWINISLIPLPVLFLIGLTFFLISMKIPNVNDKKNE